MALRQQIDTGMDVPSRVHMHTDACTENSPSLLATFAFFSCQTLRIVSIRVFARLFVGP